jgi:hypothetical protein
MAEMFIALAYLYAGVRYDDELPVETRLTIGNEMGGDFARKEFGIDIHGVLWYANPAMSPLYLELPKRTLRFQA